MVRGGKGLYTNRWLLAKDSRCHEFDDSMPGVQHRDWRNLHVRNSRGKVQKIKYGELKLMKN